MQVPAQGYPTVQPNGTPVPFQSINAPVAAFGGLSAQETEKAGARMQADADRSFATQMEIRQLRNEAATREVQNGFLQESTAMMEKFREKEGKDAVDAYPQFQQDMTALHAKYQQNFRPGTKAAAQFDAQISPTMRYMMDGAASHTAGQAKEYQRKATEGFLSSSMDSIAASSDSPDIVNQRLADGKAAIARQYKGQAPDYIEERQRDFQDRAIRAAILSDSAIDPAGAEKRLQRYGGMLSPLARKQTEKELKPVILDQQAEQIAARATGAYVQKPVGEQPHPSLVADAIMGQESGGKDGLVSINGARGRMQIMPKTFNAYAKPGEKIDNPEDNERVGRRIIDDLSAKYKGDPQRIAVAYFSGEPNVAPEGDVNPFLQDKADGNGKTVSSYVADVTNRLNGMTKAGISVGKATSMAQAKVDATGNPELDRMVQHKIAERWQIANVLASGAEKAQREQREAAADGVVKATIKGQITGEWDPAKLLTQIADDPRLDSASRQHLSNVVQVAARKDADSHDTKTYGPGFIDLFKAVHADGPNRITDERQLYPLVGSGQITVTGLDKLRTEITGRRSPEGESEAEMKRQFMKNIEQQLSAANPLIGIRDPKGQENVLKAMAVVLPMYEEGRRNGIPASEMLNPASKSYVGTAIGQFKRSPAQMLSDINAEFLAGDDATKGQQHVAPGEAPIDRESLAGLQSAVKAGKLTRTEAIAEATKRGFIRTPSAVSAPVARP